MSILLNEIKTLIRTIRMEHIALTYVHFLQCAMKVSDFTAFIIVFHCKYALKQDFAGDN